MSVQLRYEFINFTETKAGEYECWNNRHGSWLGSVRAYYPWRQFIFTPPDECVFSAGCLRDIAIFLDAVTQEHFPKRKVAEPRSDVGGQGSGAKPQFTVTPEMEQGVIGGLLEHLPYNKIAVKMKLSQWQVTVITDQLKTKWDASDRWALEAKLRAQ